MDFYGIASASMSLSSMKLAQSVNLAMLDKAMEMEAEAVGKVLEMADAAVQAPPSSQLLDVLV
ncbi:MAG: putative motility protein [Clostridiales Family XIII bacterium]|jgi:hypothetical protein|nr:putative motility protein [Clostridiales Family XIII bacterium]